MNQQTMFDMPRNAYPDGFTAFWAAYPRRSGPDPKRAAYRAWNARINDGDSVEQMVAGAKMYAQWCEATGIQGTQYIMRACTFLGPDKYFLEEYEMPDIQPKTDDEWLEAGKAHGLIPQAGESWFSFKDRVREKLGGQE